jgi:hypothetical protein
MKPYRFDTKKFFIVLFFFLLGLLIEFLFISQNDAIFKSAKLELVLRERRRMFEGEVISGMTILDALTASTLAGNIQLDYRITGSDMISIKSIDGYKPENKPVFLLNDRPVEPEEIGKKTIKPGDYIYVIAK